MLTTNTSTTTNVALVRLIPHPQVAKYKHVTAIMDINLLNQHLPAVRSRALPTSTLMYALAHRALLTQSPTAGQRQDAHAKLATKISIMHQRSLTVC